MGIPIISAITIMGSGTEKPAAKSASPRSISRSSSSRDSSRMRGSRSATTRGVKARKDQGAELGVSWRIEEDQPLRVRPVDGGEAGAERVVVVERTLHAVVHQRSGHVAVGQDHPDVAALWTHHRGHHILHGFRLEGEEVITRLAHDLLAA